LELSMLRSLLYSSLIPLLAGCFDSTLGRRNSTPSATIISHAEGDTVYEGYPLSLRGAASDPDNKNSDLVATWFVNDEELCTGAPTSDGSTECELILGMKDTAIRLEVRDIEGAASSAAISLIIVPTEPPVVSITAPTSTGTYFNGRLTEFSGVVSDNEDNVADLRIWWESSIDDLSDLDTTVDSTGQLTGFADLSEGEHAIQLFAEDLAGKVSSDSLIVNVGPPNENPTQPGIVIDPASPRAGQDDLVCAIQTPSTDADNDSLTYAFSWSVDGTPWSGSTNTNTYSGDTISGTYTQTDEMWQCEANASDGKSQSPSAFATASIVFSLPWDKETPLGDADFVVGNGTYVSSAGDVDGDGLMDLLVGSHLAEDNGLATGKAYVFLGSSIAASQTSYLSQPDYSFIGEAEWDYAGDTVSSAGDVDGDGLDDLLIGAYINDEGGNNAGKAYLILGASLSSASSINLSQADYSFIGDGKLGRPVAGLGDTNGDGLDDIAIGDPGATYLFSGSSLSTTTSLLHSDADYILPRTGHTKDGVSAGDVDGDGLNDVLIGNHGYTHSNNQTTGGAYLVYGSDLGNTSTVAYYHTFEGEKSGDSAGWAVSTAGDIDGDGLDDLLIGADGNDEGGDFAGKAYIVLATSITSGLSQSLSKVDHELIGESVGDQAGQLVATADDVDGDGLGDVLIGSKNKDGSAYNGRAYLVLGSSLSGTSTLDLSQADHSFYAASGETGPYTLSSAGDVDGDGLPDIFIGGSSNGAYGGHFFLTGP
jgi:hypothetical protein